MSRSASRWLPPVGLCAVAAVVAADTLSYPPSLVPGAPGPAFFPRLLAGLLFALGLVLAARAWRDDHGAVEPDAGAAEREGRSPERARGDGGSRPAGSPAGRLEVVRVAGGVTAIAAFLWLAPRIDTFALLPVLVASLMALMGERRAVPLLAVPLGFTLFVYLVFHRAFGVILPTSLL